MIDDDEKARKDDEDGNACQHGSGVSNVRGKRYSMAASLRARVYVAAFISSGVPPTSTATVSNASAVTIELARTARNARD